MDDETVSIGGQQEDASPTSRTALVVALEASGAPSLRSVAIRGELVVGRDLDVDLPLEDRAASRRHCTVRVGPESFVVRDLASRNGTRVDGIELRDAETECARGALLRIGRTLIVVGGPASTGRPARGVLDGGASLDDLRRDVARFGPASMPVLIHGETGTGKERVAAALHAASGRKGEFVSLNCAALPVGLVESELFGHARGAFTGSSLPRSGLLRAAHGGTLFLDEIAELPLEAQAKLLRAIDQGEIRAVGEDRVQRVDVRLLTATHRDLAARVAEGLFRQDLYFRLHGAHVELPPLRSRREDLPLVAIAILRELAPEVTLGVDASESLFLHDWPGNTRELKQTLANAAATASTARRREIEKSDLPRRARPTTTTPRRGSDERALVEQALRASDGNVAKAARELGMGRATIYKVLARLGIDPSVHRR